MTRTTLRIGLLLTCLATPVIACNDDAAIDCASICERYSECFDDEYDIDACAAKCEEAADRSEDYRNTADTCHACIDDHSCLGAVSCLADCIGVVP